MSIEEGYVFISDFATPDIWNYFLLFLEHFIFNETETDLKIESTKLQHKSANKFSQKEFDSII